MYRRLKDYHEVSMEMIIVQPQIDHSLKITPISLTFCHKQDGAVKIPTQSKIYVNVMSTEHGSV